MCVAVFLRFCLGREPEEWGLIFLQNTACSTAFLKSPTLPLIVLQYMMTSTVTTHFLQNTWTEKCT